jgi:hypothetical protein
MREILKQVIEQAVSNGWTGGDAIWVNDDGEIDWSSSEIRCYRDIIFSHDFAKAFWGDENFGRMGQYEPTLEMWQYHLQQMVLEEEPLKYLAQFLEKEKEA